ncbi:MAG: 1-deoxy-D-xylulose-5-phosphate reductoisomerase [bacterium]
MKRISILGSTGSIGASTLGVVDCMPRDLKVEGLAACKNYSVLLKQVKKYRPKAVALVDEGACEKIRKECAKMGVKLYSGLEGITKIATLNGVDTVVSSMVGAAGLIPTFEAIKKGKNIALANKEILVMAGEIIMREAKRRKVNILPLDSEHSAIFQCLKKEDKKYVNKIILTASGGPFYKKSKAVLGKVTAKQALAHPTWKMGRKITIDSATLLNKGFEIIEAQHLFGMNINNIEVFIHTESIVHSMVEFIDGSVLAQMGMPDMRLPIQYALTFPERNNRIIPQISVDRMKILHFAKPDFSKFPLLKLAREVGKTGGTLPAVLNAADELAVDAFLKGEISFLNIATLITRVLKKHKVKKKPSLDDVLRADKWARITAKEEICSQLSL